MSLKVVFEINLKIIQPLLESNEIYRRCWKTKECAEPGGFFWRTNSGKTVNSKYHKTWKQSLIIEINDTVSVNRLYDIVCSSILPSKHPSEQTLNSANQHLAGHSTNYLHTNSYLDDQWLYSCFVIGVLVCVIYDRAVGKSLSVMRRHQLGVSRPAEVSVMTGYVEAEARACAPAGFVALSLDWAAAPELSASTLCLWLPPLFKKSNLRKRKKLFKVRGLIFLWYLLIFLFQVWM